MRIRCQKESEDYKPVRGNEKEIINHLLEHDYYSYWDIEKDGNVISFNIDYKLSFTNKLNSFFKYKLNGTIEHVYGKCFVDYVAIPFSLTNTDILKIFQAPNFLSCKKFSTEDYLFKAWTFKTITDTFTVTYNDIIIFNTDYTIVDCLANNKNESNETILESNGYIIKQDD